MKRTSADTAISAPRSLVEFSLTTYRSSMRFINISQNAKHVIFSGTFTAGGLDVKCSGGMLKIVQEGRHKKFFDRIECISYSAPFALREGRTAIFITERSVLRVANGALELIEIAPGIDLEKDIVRHMACKPLIAPDLKLMDKRLFSPALMNLRSDMETKACARRPTEERIRRHADSDGTGRSLISESLPTISPALATSPMPRPKGRIGDDPVLPLAS